MEHSHYLNPNAIHSYKLDFSGKGSEYFGILIVNWLLTLITLGFYYPWAKVKRLRYLYGHMSLNGERFHFSASGHEIFIGYLKVLSFFVIISVAIALFVMYELPVLVGVTIFVFYIGLFILIPFMMHGAFRYRMSRSSYRGIRLGYRGVRKTLVLKYLGGILLTIVTMGFYGAWFEMDIRRYTLSNVRYGDAEFSYRGEGADFFLLNLKGFFLSFITLGIYSFWWYNDLFRFYVDNMDIKKDNQYIKFESTATAGRFFELIVLNTLIVLFTFGLGTAWAKMRTQRFIANNINMEGTLDLSSIHQTEAEYKNAFGNVAAGLFDLDIL